MTKQLWESQLRRGSFNGIPFNTLNSESFSGRRAQVDEPVESETWLVKDMSTQLWESLSV